MPRAELDINGLKSLGRDSQRKVEKSGVQAAINKNWPRNQELATH